MLIGKKRVILKSIGEKNNVKIFYKDDEGRFTIEGISRVDVDNAISALQSRDKKAQKKLAVPAVPAVPKVINLDDDDDVPELPASLSPAVINIDNVSGVPVSLPLETNMDHVVAGAGAAEDIPSLLQRIWTTIPDGTVDGEDYVVADAGAADEIFSEYGLHRNVDWEPMILGAEIAISDL